MLMLILYILLILVAAIILFVLFLPNNIEFRFADNFRELRFENLFFKHIFKSNDDENVGAESARPENKTDDDLGGQTPPLQDDDIFDEDETPQKEEIDDDKGKKCFAPTQTAPKENFCEKKPKDDDDFDWDDASSEDKNEIDEDSDEKSLLEWLALAKKMWATEEKLVKSLLKYTIKILKLSLKLLTPSKIEFNLSGGLEDPAETGWLYSVFLLFNSFFEENRRVSLSFDPRFNKEEWKYNGSLMYVFSLARLLLFVLLILVFIRI
jgi:hypothetical protein